MVSLKDDLWVEKYRPKNLDDFVWQDNNQRAMIEQIIKIGKLPNMLITGSPGVGKTTLARIIINELKIEDTDVMEINGSVENGIDVIREKIYSFVSRVGLGNIRCVLFDEADYLSHHSQASLRNIIETYANNARFIFTCNYHHKIIPALKSRCQHYHISELNKDNFILRAGKILIEENIDFSVETLKEIVDQTFPDMRKCINMLQQSSVNGKLIKSSIDEKTLNPEWYDIVVKFLKEKKINEARKYVVNVLPLEEYEDFYRFLYENLNLYCDDEEEEKIAILTIREGLVNHSICADREINLSATMVKLSMIKQIKEGKI